MNFGNNVNFNLNQLLNVLAQILGADPSTPTEGQFWYNSSTKKLMYRDNTGNRDVTYLAQVLALRLDQFAAPNTSLSMGSQKIVSLADGTSAQDAATYSQLQAVSQGRSFKDSVRVATTGNITLSGTQTIDGVSVAAGERVLVKNQTTGSENGIYVVASGAWTRATDADTSAKVKSGMTVYVDEGSTNGDKQFSLTTNDPITLATTALVFAVTGAGTSYTGGTGISVSGSTISIDTSVVPQKYSVDYGDGSTTSFTITHNLGTKDVIVSIRKKSTDEIWLVDATAATTNTVTIAHAVAPTTNEFRVTIHA